MNINLSFFADENISTDLINWFESKGYPISNVREKNMQGVSDIEIIQKCFTSRKIILTQDNDFGKLILRQQLLFILSFILGQDISMESFIFPL